MKKLAMVLGVAALFAGTTSCKKDYTCTCETAGIEVSSRTINDTKSNATDDCNSGDGEVLTVVTDCEIQ